MKKYDPLKEVRLNTGMIMTEAIGYSVAGKLAGDIGVPAGLKVFETGSSLAGVPSLVHSSGSVIRSLDMLNVGKKKKGLY